MCRRSGERSGAGQAALRLCVWGAVAALSLGLAAVELAPQLGVRPWLLRDHDALARTSIPRRYHLRSPERVPVAQPDGPRGPGRLFRRDNYWETLLSIGLIPLFSATLAVFLHPDRKLVRGWLVLVGLAVWFACGRASLAVYGSLLHRARDELVPGAGTRSFLANLGGAVLAGLGVQALATRLADRRDWRRFAARCGGLMLS